MERLYTIPLRDAWKTSIKRRSKKAITVLKAFTLKHMKADNVKVGPELNKHIWVNGKQNPPRKVKVQVLTEEVEDKKIAWVELENVKFEIPKKIDKTDEKADSKKTEDVKATEKPKKTDEKATPKKSDKTPKTTDKKESKPKKDDKTKTVSEDKPKINEAKPKKAESEDTKTNVKAKK
ncbi:MAG: 60S ribosomal protein L31 [DPANN group archaeon]|nr:60S ribosomal protein L31 [DPANN group archaeon]